MLQIALTAVAWYTIPKGIEYFTSRPSNLESRIDCIRARLFVCKLECQRLANTNGVTRFVWKATYIPYSHMWLATLIMAGFTKLLHLTASFQHPASLLLCYSLFYSKEHVELKLVNFINSTRILRFITSKVGFRLVSSDIGLRLINQHTKYTPENQELLDVLNERLDYVATKELLTTASSENSFSIINRTLISRLCQEDRYKFTFRTKLPNLPDYPEDIHDIDPILSKLRCPILGRPPRSIIVDPTNDKIIYDHKTFEVYLRTADDSPITRKKIPQRFYGLEGGSKYDSIITYRKACLQLRKPEDLEVFTSDVRKCFTSGRNENPKVFVSKMFLLNLKACLQLKKLEDPETFISQFKIKNANLRILVNLPPFILEVFVANLEAARLQTNELNDPENFISQVFIPNLEKAYLQLESQDLKNFLVEEVIPNLEKMYLQLESEAPKELMVKNLMCHLSVYLKSRKKALTLEEFQGSKSCIAEKNLIDALEKACLQLYELQEIKEAIFKEIIPKLKTYLKLSELYNPKEFIDKELGSKLRTYLRLKELQDPEKFIANLKHVFAEVSKLNNANEIKDASEAVRDFFQEGFFAAYDVTELLKDQRKRKEQLAENITQNITPDQYRFYKTGHNSNQYEDNMRPITEPSFNKESVRVSINDFEQYPFIVEELNLEIQKIKTQGKELIQDFL